jgi:ubiquinone/menaquinone biosynthesis C-methylase UbiE
MNESVLDKKFDIVVFAASIQYFPSLSQIIGRTISILNPGGEIHILDSPFYPDSEITSAERRSDAYYRSTGFEEMTKFYFHHSLESIKRFDYKILFDPHRPLNKLLGRKDPFPWICIKAT